MQNETMDQLHRKLEAMERARIKDDEELAKVINGVLFQLNRLGNTSARQQKKEILSHVYQKASGYTNLVMFGGYAAAFAIWQLTKEHLSRDQSMIVGFLIIVSVILFAGFEVYKMISQAFFLRKLNRVLKKDIPLDQHDDAWQIAWDEFAAAESRMWALFLAPTIITGFGAGFYLLWVFSVNLVKSI